MTAAFQKATAGLYEAFASEPHPTVIEGCPCCISEAATCLLVSKPLRSLTREDLSAYASSVFLTVGSESDFRYFLPRILDLLVTKESCLTDPEIVGRAIAAAGWERFSSAQQTAVLAFFDAVLMALIEHADGYAIDSWICAFAKFGPDLDHYLKIIEMHPAALLAYYETNSQPLGRQKLRNGFWHGDSAGEQVVLKWFQSESAKHAVNVAYGMT